MEIFIQMAIPFVGAYACNCDRSTFGPPDKEEKRLSALDRGLVLISMKGLTMTLLSPQIRIQPSDLGATTIGTAQSL